MAFKSFFDKITNLVSLVVALVSLIVAIIALNISDTALLLSSRDYKPQFDYTYKDNDDIVIKNPQHKLYKIEYIGIIEIGYVGVVLYDNNNNIIQLPYVKKSSFFDSFTMGDYERKTLGKKITVNPKNSVNCHRLCPYNEIIMDSLQNLVRREYHLESKIGFMQPSLQNGSYYITVGYFNRNGERGNVTVKRSFMHGGLGYDNETIPEEVFDKIIQRADLPEFDDAAQLWEYACRKFQIEL